jgi:hypothetical protein
MSKATKTGANTWRYCGFTINRCTHSRTFLATRPDGTCCGAGGVCRSKDDAKTAIDAMLRQAQSILESEAAICPDWHLCRHGIDN